MYGVDGSMSYGAEGPPQIFALSCLLFGLFSENFHSIPIINSKGGGMGQPLGGGIFSGARLQPPSWKWPLQSVKNKSKWKRNQELAISENRSKKEEKSEVAGRRGKS